MMREWAGTTVEWTLLELMIFFFYVFTMLILVFRGQFVSTGIDNTKQFEPI